MREIYDIIIVGCGIAGLSAAIFLKEAGLNVVVLTKEDESMNTCTNLAQGGIIAWKDGDTPKKITYDILHAGCRNNKRSAVTQFSHEGPHLVFDFLINKIGIEFSKTSEGILDYTKEAAHSERRIVHYNDQTGHVLQKGLIAYAQKINIPILHSHTAIELKTHNQNLKDTHECHMSREVMGVYFLDNANNDVMELFAHRVILATGGIGNLYRLTTNPSSATGDGLSMAYRAGAEIAHAEYIQFHPTAFYNKDIKGFIISESLRGEGARLVDHQHKPFMERYSPLADLAPRDVVTRALYQEMKKSGSEYMFLDIASYYHGKVPLQKRFPKVYSTCLQGAVDITKEPIPVVPSAHFLCGGIKVNLVGQSTIRNLYAIGEVSCTGLHGANRLASTSLLEGVLWGKKAAENIISNFSKTEFTRLNVVEEWEKTMRNENFDTQLCLQELDFIKNIMWNNVGIVRTKNGLEKAIKDLQCSHERIMKYWNEYRLRKDLIELRNAVVAALIITRAAYKNNKSSGCHYVL